MSEGPGGGWGVEGGGEPPPDPPPPGDRLVPPGCNPLVFGVVMATIQMAAVLWLLYCR